LDPKGQSLLKLLFNPGEEVCVTPNELGFHSIPLEKALSGDIELILPNEGSPVIHCNSSDLILTAINPIKGFKRDCFVTAFRSFLIEYDDRPLKDQISYIKYLKMPFSAQVFSGNKSIHTVIVLNEDLTDEKTYRYIGNWIFNIMAGCDKNCKNPSRAVRIPGAYREPGKKQRLVELKGRVSHKELFSWLNLYEHKKPKFKERKTAFQGDADFSLLSPWCRYMMLNGVDFKNRGRNQTWYAIAYDFALAGFTLDKTIDILQTSFSEESDFKEKEWLTTINSAFKKVEENN
jgi:hypothetical protein